MARERISSNVSRKTVLRIIEAAKRLSVSISRYIEIAVEAELDKLDSRAEIERLKKEQKHLVDQRDVARIQRDVACESIKTIATKLGATNDVAACKQKIDKLQAEATEAQEQRDRFESKYEGARASMEDYKRRNKDLITEATEARRQRDHFKAKFDAALEDLAVAEAKIDALQNRGLLARIFNRKPKI